MDNVNVKLVEWFDSHFYKVEYEKETDGKIETIIDYIPSVTTKLNVIPKPFLSRWRGDIGNREADLRIIESQDRGSRIHLAWQVYTEGGAVVWRDIKKPQYTQQEILDIENQFGKVCILNNQDEMYDLCKLQKFYNIINPTLTISEMIIYDIENRDAGTLDNIFKIAEGDYKINGTKPVHLNEGIYIFDLKSGNTIGEAKKQCAAYAKIVEKMGTFSPAGAIIGHTGAKTKNGIEGFSATVMDLEEIEKEYEGYKLASQMWEKEMGHLKPTVRELPTLIYKEEQNEAAKQ